MLSTFVIAHIVHLHLSFPRLRLCVAPFSSSGTCRPISIFASFFQAISLSASTFFDSRPPRAEPPDWYPSPTHPYPANASDMDVPANCNPPWNSRPFFLCSWANYIIVSSLPAVPFLQQRMKQIERLTKNEYLTNLFKQSTLIALPSATKRRAWGSTGIFPVEGGGSSFQSVNSLITESH
ncbi:hypothetical protein PCANC_25922 [Puccinia coronata f. sp. avenae]|uniref:Uncharacterized protein n=1 Tax=Puccinia coronata f. sp. avenae TaxID=200324 RepID=A0A2N5RXA4_9BASI|nr:hypothetical protein PCANC_27860 [Puccinia coronata f. sp. avenae]PLW25723.1 hypothetical protein PCANC_25922 [Puccinia coronata f. sp. avenae]